ncbi:pentapeptide repeat-containing protein [Cryobacterium sp. TMT1-2-2]|uniref:pentapeptide repeat-containing protein n=1 Tax=Cryobacterium sp. TMT1-2-2 TaxID=1259233 RepID=UPI003519F2E4
MLGVDRCGADLLGTDLLGTDLHGTDLHGAGRIGVGRFGRDRRYGRCVSIRFPAFGRNDRDRAGAGDGARGDQCESLFGVLGDAVGALAALRRVKSAVALT